MDGAEDDVALMLAFRGGEEAAFDKLFRRWSRPLLRYLERMLGDAACAEEMLQEAFLRVFHLREYYQPNARFSSFLYTIATNLALNELRRPARRRPHDSVDDDSEWAIPLASQAPRADDVAHARQLAGGVELALDALPDKQRIALWLTAVEGLSYDEVAESLEISEASVKSLVHRARVKLAERLRAGSPRT